MLALGKFKCRNSRTSTTIPLGLSDLQSKELYGVSLLHFGVGMLYPENSLYPGTACIIADAVSSRLSIPMPEVWNLPSTLSLQDVWSFFQRPYMATYSYTYSSIYIYIELYMYSFSSGIHICMLHIFMFLPQPLPKSKWFEPIPEVFVWLGSYGGSRSLPATSGTSGGLWRSRWIKA